MTNDRYRMPLKDASRSFGVGYQKLWTAVSEGELAGLQIGTRWTVRPEDVEEYLQRIGTPNAAEQARNAS